MIALARDDVRAVIHGGSGEGATEDGDGRPGGAASASARRFVDASFVGDPNALCVLTELLCTHGDEDGETHELSEEASDVRAACALALERRPVDAGGGGDARRDLGAVRSVRRRRRRRLRRRASASRVRSPHAGPRTTAFARCTPFLEDFCPRAILSAQGPSLSIPTHRDVAFELRF